MSAGGDAGRPVAAGNGPLATVFADLARVVAEEVAPPVAGVCTARLLDRVEAAVRAGTA